MFYTHNNVANLCMRDRRLNEQLYGCTLNRSLIDNLKRIVTRSPAIARIADRTGCQWPSRSSKVNDFLNLI